jgi:hypothetical protein
MLNALIVIYSRLVSNSETIPEKDIDRQSCSARKTVIEGSVCFEKEGSGQNTCLLLISGLVLS